MTCFDSEDGDCSFQEGYKYGVSEGMTTVRAKIILLLQDEGYLLEDAIAILDDLDGLKDKAIERIKQVSHSDKKEHLV